MTKYGWRVLYPENLELGHNVDIGWGCLIHAAAGVKIEDDVQIGGGTMIFSVSTLRFGEKRKKWEGPVIIKQRSEIGCNTVIMPKVKIGMNAQIGSFSFIDKDVPANTVLIPKQEFLERKRKWLYAQ